MQLLESQGGVCVVRHWALNSGVIRRYQNETVIQHMYGIAIFSMFRHSDTTSSKHDLKI